MSSTDDTASQEKYHKPSFDARMRYTEELEKWWIQIRVASISNNYTLWLDSLRGMYSFTRPFIQEEQNREKLSGCMQKAYNLYNFYSKRTGSNRSFMESKLKNALYEYQDVLYVAIKHLLLPSLSEDDEDFDAQDFMRRSQAR